MARLCLALALTAAAAGCADGSADRGGRAPTPAAEATPSSTAATVDVVAPGAPDPEVNPDPAPKEPAELPGSAATYHVPVPPELEPYASFPLTDLRFRERGGEWTLDYTLPVLLVGNDQNLSFRGSEASPGELDLQGEAGQVTCRAEAAGYRCDEVLDALEFDADKLERALGGLPEAERRGRRAVATHFADDPIGVLTFPR